jgi:hypothetical protein
VNSVTVLICPSCFKAYFATTDAAKKGPKDAIRGTLLGIELAEEEA